MKIGSKLHEKLRAYLDAVLEANRSFNLTAVRDPELAWSKHILDSLQAFQIPEEESTFLFEKGRKVIDIGTGAGFPGMVLAIARPEIAVTLLDSTRKKCNFLEGAAQIHAPGTKVLCARAEEAARDPELRGRFDLAVARAVGSFPEMCELCLPFVKVGGAVLLWRGQEAHEEIQRSQNALRLLKARAEVLLSYQLPEHEMQYHLTLIRKLKPTPNTYPRRTGLPKQQPL